MHFKSVWLLVCEFHSEIDIISYLGKWFKYVQLQRWNETRHKVTWNISQSCLCVFVRHWLVTSWVWNVVPFGKAISNANKLDLDRAQLLVCISLLYREGYVCIAKSFGSSQWSWFIRQTSMLGNVSDQGPEMHWNPANPLPGFISSQRKEAVNTEPVS